MPNTYLPLSEAAKSQYGDAAVSLDLSVMDEKDAIDGGHLAVAPRKYQVLSDNYAAGKQGAVVELALLKENEAALTQGGHLKRVDVQDTVPPVDEPPAEPAEPAEPAGKKASK